VNQTHFSESVEQRQCHASKSAKNGRLEPTNRGKGEIVSSLRLPSPASLEFHKTNVSVYTCQEGRDTLAAANAKFVEDYNNARIIVNSGAAKANAKATLPTPPVS
jgi:hypothetical protein